MANSENFRLNTTRTKAWQSSAMTFCRRCLPERRGASVRDWYDEPFPVPPLEESCISGREASSLDDERIWFLDYLKPAVDKFETSSSNSARQHADRSKREQTSWGSLTPSTILQHVHNFTIPNFKDQSPGHKLRLVLINPVANFGETRRDTSSPFTKLPLATEHISDLLEHFSLPFAYLASRNDRYGSDTFLRLVSHDDHSKTPWIAIRFPHATKSDLEPMTIVLSSNGDETYGVLEGLPIERWKAIFSARRLRIDGGVTPEFVLSLLISDNTIQLLHAVQRLELAFREFETQSSARTIGDDLNPVIVFPKFKLQKRGTDMGEPRRRRYTQKPVFPKVRKADVSPETLKYYDLGWEEDSDPDYLIIMKELNDKEIDMIFEHTSRLKGRGIDMSEPRQRRYTQESVFPKVRKVDVSPETLKFYDLKWKEDSDPDYLIIVEELNDKEIDIIFKHTSRLKGPTSTAVKDYFDNLLKKRDASSITREKSRRDAAERNVSALRLSELRKQLTDLTYASDFNSRIASAVLKPVLKEQALSQDDISSWLRWGGSSVDAMIVEQLENSLSHSSSMLERLAGLEKRADGASALMFNSASHRENELNRQIAEVSRDIAAAAKRDSWQMKSIAIVTLLFLPPTAVSTFFSMGFFNWQNATKSDDVVNPYFWVYWAVAVPITILVILAWDIYTKWREDTEEIDGYIFSFERNVWVNSLTQEDVDITPDADGLLFWQFNPLLVWPIRVFIFFVRYFRLWLLLPAITRFQFQSWDLLKKGVYRDGDRSELFDEDYLERSREIHGHRRRLGVRAWFRGRHYGRRARSQYSSGYSATRRRARPRYSSGYLRRPRRSMSSSSSPNRRTRVVEDNSPMVRRGGEKRSSINDDIGQAVTNANVERGEIGNVDLESGLARIEGNRYRGRDRGRRSESD